MNHRINEEFTENMNKSEHIQPNLNAKPSLSLLERMLEFLTANFSVEANWLNFFQNQQRNRFRFLSWPLTVFEQSEEIRKDDFPLSDKLKKIKYPIRALRYWWLHCAIHEEFYRTNKPPVIVDVGCERGMLKRFVLPIEGAYWIGLDIHFEADKLPLANYNEFHQCDFDNRLPLNDSIADIVVCSHVLEHVSNPEATMSELVRILRPGGMALIGVPVVPKLLALIRERQFDKEFQTGKRHKGLHRHAFWPNRIRLIAERCGLDVEFMNGTYFLRKKGNRLDNFALWIRANQLWGALFPSLGQELCAQLRKLA